MLLRLENIFGDIISEDNIILSQGDILVCKFNISIDSNLAVDISNRIKKSLENPETNSLIIPDFIDIKIIKREA